MDNYEINKIIQRQMSFLIMPDNVKKLIMEENDKYLENAIPFEEWTLDKIRWYFFLFNSSNDSLLKFNIAGLLASYEQWVRQNNKEKYNSYKTLLDNQKILWMQK